MLGICRCSKCGNIRELGSFAKRKNCKHGRGLICKACAAKYARDYRKKNKGKIKIQREKNWEKTAATRKKYYKKDYVKKKYAERRKLLAKDHTYRIHMRMSSAISKQLKSKNIKKDSSWLNYVEYTRNDLIKHLKKTLLNFNKKSDKKYTWQDFIDGKLHIDHILPRVMFEFESPNDEQFRRCWSLDNLQLLPALDNLKKGANCENFQITF